MDTKALIATPIFILLTACATGYTADGLLGGYSDMQLGENLYQVSFRGNGYTSSDRAANLALLRAAEITLSNGASHFAIVDGNTSSQQQTHTTPQNSYTTGTINTYGSMGSYNSQTTTYGGQTITISKPKSKNFILIVDDPENFNGPLLNATTISNSVKEKYGIE